MKKFTILITFVLATIITGSAFAHDVKVSSTDKLVIHDWGFIDKDYTDKKGFKVVIKNMSGQKVLAMKTRFICLDLFGEELFSANYKDPVFNQEHTGTKTYRLDVWSSELRRDGLVKENFECTMEETQIVEEA
jgi:hypothetical protein